MKTITVVTGTRADYHLLMPVLKKINRNENLKLDLVVTGSHLSVDFGHTVDFIKKDGFKHFETINILNSDSNINVSIATMIVEMDKHFQKVKSDLLLILGDRYEILGAVIAASNHHVPIAHIHGGEVTEGAIDDSIRHAITKFSHLHFTSCEAYRKRVIQLGENPEFVFNVGALGVENIKKTNLLSKEELEKNLNFNLNNFSVVTFHPVTLESDTAKEQTHELMDALLEIKNQNYIVTKSNADKDGDTINRILDEYQENYPERFKVVYSLGLVRYLSALKYANLVIGNSSSGILEAPSFNIPTINIGDRQKGRIQAKSIINCKPKKNDIILAMQKGLSKAFIDSIENSHNPYEKDNTSDLILDIVLRKLDQIDLKKHFFDL